jgi:hypothetical protein
MAQQAAPAYPGSAPGGDIPATRPKGVKILPSAADITAACEKFGYPLYLEQPGLLQQMCTLFGTDVWTTMLQPGSIRMITAVNLVLYTRLEQVIRFETATRDKLEHHMLDRVRAFAPTLFGAMPHDQICSVLGLRDDIDSDPDSTVGLLKRVAFLSQVVMRVWEAMPTEEGKTYPIPLISQIMWQGYNFIDLTTDVQTTPTKLSPKSALQQERELTLRLSTTQAEEREQQEREHQAVVDELAKLRAEMPAPDSTTLTKADALANEKKLEERLTAAMTTAIAQALTRATKKTRAPAAAATRPPAGDDDDDFAPPTKRSKTHGEGDDDDDDDLLINSGERMSALLSTRAVKVSNYIRRFCLPKLEERLSKQKWGYTLDYVYSLIYNQDKSMSVQLVTDTEGNTSYQTQELHKAKITTLHQIMECIQYICSSYSTVNEVGGNHLRSLLPFAVNLASVAAGTDVQLIKMYTDRILKGYFDGIARGTNIDLAFDKDTFADVKQDLQNLRQEEQRQKQLLQNTKGGGGKRGGDKKPPADSAGGKQFAKIEWVDGPPNLAVTCRNHSRGFPCKIFNKGTKLCHYGHSGAPGANSPPANTPP